MAFYDFFGYGKFPRYVPVAERRATALKQARKLEKRGRVLQPVSLTGQRIASSFWGKAWCKNLESYMDFSNRLPRGRTYLRSGAVVDLRIGAGQVDALVAGTSLYEVSVRIDKLARKRWGAVIKRCAGHIESVVGLLQGKLSDKVMEALVDRRAGLFPEPKEIDFTCSCPDSAILCKHVAAVLYGVGARLDQKPELFFMLRRVALDDFVTRTAVRRAPSAKEALATESLEGIFGIELDRSPRRRGR
ncbi:MAG TPA: SWIM zinc finger family protein [Myxococcales bacterium]|nr:SWIM zinc finger family protein [Myxococcales bacterium]